MCSDNQRQVPLSEQISIWVIARIHVEQTGLSLYPPGTENYLFLLSIHSSGQYYKAYIILLLIVMWSAGTWQFNSSEHISQGKQNHWPLSNNMIIVNIHTWMCIIFTFVFTHSFPKLFLVIHFSPFKTQILLWFTEAVLVAPSSALPFHFYYTAYLLYVLLFNYTKVWMLMRKGKNVFIFANNYLLHNKN